MVQALVSAVEGAPRVGPSLPLLSLAGDVLKTADAIDLPLWPWQEHFCTVSMATKADGTFLYREVAGIASRRNGKSKILVPRIKWAIDNGRRVIHTAQNAKLPRRIFTQVANLYPDAHIRMANGQEEITAASGGSYIIVAPQRAARGEDADDLIIDELREMEDFDFIAAAEPILASSPNPQVIYLSNAGTEKSVVLNDLRNRAGTDDQLAYMEWSAAPELAVDDETGWMQANPSIGYGNLTLDRLRSLYQKYRLAGELAVFETEHLCRWVQSMAPRLVPDTVWQAARRELEPVIRPVLGVSVDPNGRAAAGVLAWKQSDGSVGLMMATENVTGDPIDLAALAADLVPLAEDQGVTAVAFDPWTDKHLARHFPNAQPIQGQDFANASERFVRDLETGRLRWQWADQISAELPYASRRSTTGTAWVADRANSDRPITSVLAAIRAHWLASAPDAGVGEIY